MIIEALRQKNTGVLETRSLTITVDDREYEERYFLVKGKEGEYFIGFSDGGMCCSEHVCEKYMLQLLNDEELSAEEALSIYMKFPQLSCWID